MTNYLYTKTSGISFNTGWAPINPGGAPAYGTTLPTLPVDGQEAILVDSVTTPTYQWRFRFNAGSANTEKWEFIGGSPAFIGPQSIAVGAGTNNTGAGFTLPRAGVYIQQLSAEEVNIFANSSADGTSFNNVGRNQFTGDATGNLSGPFRWPTKAAATLLSANCQNTGGSSITFTNVTNIITPVRVS